jgi:nucleotide-binding universal stress UspA family protein
MKKVLIAIDYNSSAKKVAETGYQYASLMNAEISIVYTMTDISYYTMEDEHIMGFEGFSPDQPFMNIYEQKHEAYNFLECVASYLGGKNIKTSVLDERSSETILDYANQWKADLIVMGTQTPTGYEKLKPGNVTSHILKKSEVPVLVIPPEIEETDVIESLYRYFH